MKRTIIAIVAMVCALTITANAGQGGKKKDSLTDEQKKVTKEMTEKYDTNKNGKIDKEERAKMSKEDKKAWNKAFPRKKKESEEDKKPQ
jgi:hypothetical protein